MAKPLAKIVGTFEKTRKELVEFVRETTAVANAKDMESRRLEREADSLRAECNRALEISKNIGGILGHE